MIHSCMHVVIEIGKLRLKFDGATEMFNLIPRPYRPMQLSNVDWKAWAQVKAKVAWIMIDRPSTFRMSRELVIMAAMMAVT